MVSATAWGQKVKITGTVIDNTNEPVIGGTYPREEKFSREESQATAQSTREL